MPMKPDTGPFPFNLAMAEMQQTVLEPILNHGERIVIKIEPVR